jgi:hypothetical protein
MAQLLGIRYLLERKDNIIKDIYNNNDELSISSNYIYYILIIFLNLSSGLFEIISYQNGDVILFFAVEPTSWSFALDVYRHIVGYLALFLLSNIVWMLVHISLEIRTLSDNPLLFPARFKALRCFMWVN